MLNDMQKVQECDATNAQLITERLVNKIIYN